MPVHAASAVEEVYRSDWGRIVATLIRLIGDFDLAEEAAQEAFAAAVDQWPVTGVPDFPRAWIVQTARHKAIDRIRHQARTQEKLDQYAAISPAFTVDEEPDFANHEIPDDQLRLIFTCCHPAIAPETQVALTLREVCGLTTEEIARAFLTTSPTIAQRIVRGKAKIRDAGIPYEVPSVADVPERLEPVLSVIYIVFNEGYSASSGDSLTRADLSTEAIRLGRLLCDLLPDAEVLGLLALMLLQESRRSARSTESGDLVLLEDQDRSLWNRSMITEGTTLIERAFASGQVGVYAIQAAIAAIHANASEAGSTDWNEIVALYDTLLEANSSPIVQLNRAVAVAMRDGPQAGLDLIEGLARAELAEYHLAHAVRADLFRRLGKSADAKVCYQRALELTRQEPERRFLESRLRELS